jgi:type II secretory pathway component HofQ
VGGWWRLDEVIEPSLQPVCSRAQEVVHVAPTPIEVEADDRDHDASDQVTTEPRRSTRTRTTSEWYAILS